MRIANVSPWPPFGVALFVIAVSAFASWRHPAPPVPPVVVCAEAPVSAPVVDPEPVPPILRLDPPKPTPGPDVWARLEACLRSESVTTWVHDVHVEDVRRYVEVEHDPVWRENGSWWLPLSGEGDERFPSGLYISVPDTGSTCGGAIVN